MNATSTQHRGSRLRLRSVYRVVIAIVLVASFGMEIVPCGLVESVPIIAGEQDGCMLRLEQLQVCDRGDAFRGALIDLPVLLPGAPGIFPSPAVRRHVPEVAASAADGFRPAIDRPPRHPA